MLLHIEYSEYSERINGGSEQKKNSIIKYWNVENGKKKYENSTFIHIQTHSLFCIILIWYT